jgi:carbon monoxide dehydrogenase subunit G
MEVKLDKRYPVAASAAQAWAVLSDVRATAACMPGAQITEQIDATRYKGTVKSKVGPAVMTFNGDIEVLGLDSATQMLQMLGKGADKAGSSASMNLTARIEPDGAGSVLVGSAVVTVSGKLAQFGSRLLVPVSEAMLAQFAGNFNSAALAIQLETPADVGEGETSSSPATSPAASPASVAAPAPLKELNAVGLMWTVFKSWLAGLFGRKT